MFNEKCNAASSYLKPIATKDLQVKNICVSPMHFNHNSLYELLTTVENSPFAVEEIAV